MEAKSLPLEGGFQVFPEFTFSPARTVNMYDVYPKMGKKRVLLRRFNGIKMVASLVGGVGRNTFVYGQYLYVVIGNKVYRLDSALAVTPLGTLNTLTGHVGIAANQRQPTEQIIFVDGVDGWIWDGSTFTQITDPNFLPNPIDVTYQNSYFVVVSGQSDRWQLSDINNGLVWPAQNVLAINRQADICTGCATLNGILFIFGENHIEPFNFIGGASPPYVPDNSFSPNAGCASTPSIIESGTIDDSGNGSIFFLSNTKDGKPSMMKITGTSLIPIKHEPLNTILQTYPSLSDFEGDSYSEGGHAFYQISSTLNNKTWIYDDETGNIYEREMLDKSRYIGTAHAYFNHKNYWLDYRNGNIYEGSPNVFSNNGEPMRCRRTSPVLIEEDYRRVLRGRLKVDCSPAEGTLIPPNNNPFINLSVSNDGGATYSIHETQALAPLGVYLWRTIFRRLAVGLYTVIDLECTNDVDFNIYGAMLETLGEPT